jgi:hypothetical protein
MYKDLLQRATRHDGVDEKSIAALEVVAACNESLGCLKEAETLLEEGIKKANLETKELKAMEAVACDKMPEDCRSSNLSWEEAQRRGAKRVQFNIWTRAFNLRVTTENDMKTLMAQKAGVAKDVEEAEIEVQTAEDKVSGVPRVMTEGIGRGLKVIKADTTKHFGGTSFAGGAAMKFLENREQFFAEVLRELPDDVAAASIRDIFLPLMALMEELAHEVRRAKVSKGQ